ncbi:MAG: hypothetical protein ACPGTP_01065 [Bacteroidia bacterium]
MDFIEKQSTDMKVRFKLASFIVISILLLGCNKEPTGPADLIVSDIEFTEAAHWKLLDLPDGTYQPDNPNFHPDHPETWTGNMAKYVKNYYSYNTSYRIQNNGVGIAYDTEIDFYYSFDDGTEEVKTGKLGDIQPGRNFVSHGFINSTDKQLEQCEAEIYWYDY